MRFEITLFPLMATLAAAFCAAPNVTEANKDATRAILNDTIPNRYSIDIDVYYHVIARFDLFDYGWIDQVDVTRQHEVLAKAFSPYAFNFHYMNASWTQSKTMYDARNQIEMKRKLRQGNYADLNVYILPAISHKEMEPGVYISPPKDTNFTGSIHHFPQHVKEGDVNFIGDGILLDFRSLFYDDRERVRSFGGFNFGFFNGTELVHQVGHWLGLYHTYEGGCTGDNDLIDDTPAHMYKFHLPHNGCLWESDTCEGNQEIDPARNYMSYTVDSCMWEFTPLQRFSMHAHWEAFRKEWKGRV